MKFLEFFKKLLYPNTKCIVCNEELFTNDAFSICPKCLNSLHFLDDKICCICGVKLYGEGKLCERCKNNEYREIKLARSVFEYDDIMKNLIHSLKYDNKKYLAKPLSNILYNYFTHHNEINDVDIIIPVPLHKSRYKKRGYNQTELLLQSFKETHQIRTDIVERIKDTPTQTKLSLEERRKNLENAFSLVKPEDIKNKRILIVDDIFTTGATTLTLAKLLVKNKARSVKCLTLCHTSKKLDFEKEYDN